jgi:hypothetical protein
VTPIFNSLYQQPTLRLLPAGATVAGWDIFPPTGCCIEPERQGAQSVEFTNKTEPAIEAKIPGTSVKASVGGEREVKYTVTYPEVIGANLTNRAIWTFRAPSEDHELRLDHPLRLTVDFPQHLDALRAGLTVRARVAFRGFPWMIPLIGRRTASDTGLIRLDE